MKILFSISTMLLALSMAHAGVESAKKTGAIALEPPRMEGGMPLMKALKYRRTDRNISEKDLTARQVSDILWSANGVNRSDGKRTAPAAMNRQEIEIYAVTREGIYLWDQVKNLLVPVAEGDHRAVTGRQDFAAKAPLNLVYVLNSGRKGDGTLDEDRIRWACIAAGSMTQNVALYCASEKLANVVRGWIDRGGFGKAAKLHPDQFILIAQTVGVPK